MNVIVKGDTDGSVEALARLIHQAFYREGSVIVVIYKAVGQISENDVTLASASDAIIVGFQVRPSAEARKAADRDGVEIVSTLSSTMLSMTSRVRWLVCSNL